MEITIKLNENEIICHKEAIFDIISKISDTEKLQQQNQVQHQKQVQEKEQKQLQPQYTYKQIHEAARKKSESIEDGVVKIKAILKKYNVEKMPDLKENDFVSFMQDLEALK